MDGSQFNPAGNDNSVPNCHPMNHVGNDAFYRVPSTFPPNLQCCNNQNGVKSQVYPNYSSRLWCPKQHCQSQSHEVPAINIAAKTPLRRKNDTFAEVPEVTRLKSNDNQSNDREVPTAQLNTAPTPSTSKRPRSKNAASVPPTRKYVKVPEDKKTEKYNARLEGNRIAVKKNREKAKARLQSTVKKMETLIRSSKNIKQLLPQIRRHLSDKLQIPPSDELYRTVDKIELECEIAERAEVEYESDVDLPAILSSAV
ncbi:hypothetical protein DdX_09235 [Ditylenchus destructor]|uniref:BZIP domain-containing protein n=1 Tax=Ditylenchus destructor TaxID=166010 RepID=A0AAD4N293_9BILA|nr:hypothetical protein DdX_09235 [Ditylenchus destructor]